MPISHSFVRDNYFSQLSFQVTRDGPTTDSAQAVLKMELDLEDLKRRYVRRLRHQLLRSALLVVIIYGFSSLLIQLLLLNHVSSPILFSRSANILIY